MDLRLRFVGAILIALVNAANATTSTRAAISDKAALLRRDDLSNSNVPSERREHQAKIEREAVWAERLERHDGRHERTALPPNTVEMPAEIIEADCTFIRHGTSVWNQMKAEGQSGLKSPYDAPLTKAGKEDATSTGAALHTLNAQQHIWTPQKTAVMVSNLDRAQLTGALAALGIEDSDAWKLYIMSSMQETAKGFDAGSELPKFEARALSEGNLQDLGGVDQAKLRTLYAGAVTVWNKGNHFWRQWGTYHRHFPKYVAWLKKQNPDSNFLLAGHSHWFMRMVEEYGDASCKTIGSDPQKPGHLNNGEAVRFTLKTSSDGVEFKGCTTLHGGRGGGHDDGDENAQDQGDKGGKGKDDQGDDAEPDPLPPREGDKGKDDKKKDGK